MAGELTRQEARLKFDDLCRRVRDKYLPEDMGQKVAEGKFWEWEDQADALDRELTAGFLEILGRMSGQAKLESPGSCPFCQSVHVRWLDAGGQRERRSKHGAVVLPRQVAQCRSCDRSFSPQEQAWGLDAQAGLTPQALAKVCRESATTQSFDVAAQSINEDWATSYDGKQMQRWSEYVGGKLVALEEAERREYGKGKRPEGPANAPELLVVGMDGGRVQGRQKDPDTQSRWKEDKVLTISSYVKGDGKDQEPKRLVTTYVATMGKSQDFGTLARVEAERRGIRQARQVVVMGDAAGWIDTVHDEHFSCHERIVDYSHAVERLWECARALEPAGHKSLGERLESDLYEGRLPKLLQWLEKQVEQLGAARANDPEKHPRRVLAENRGYFERHQQHMDYPRYRANGWPIGSGVTESGVKLFNKRVKGTDQFWNTRGQAGVEAILALRALRLSEDDRWHHYMLYGHLLRPAA